MTIVLPGSAILRDLGENFSGAHGKKFLSELEAEFVRTISCAAHLIRDNARAIEAGDKAFDDEQLSLKPRFARNRHLAASTECAQQSAFCGHGRMRSRMIESSKL